jgi:ribosomal-protein-alanine N-acetyltransferase
MTGKHALRTARLVMRPWRDEDRIPFAALNADPRVMEFFPAVLTAEQSDALVARCASEIAGRGWGLWAVEVPGVAPFIGFIGLAIAGPGPPCTGQVEVGWRLAAAHWGKGYATEGAREALRFAFEELGLPEVVSFTAAVNRRSWEVMERLGMRRDPETFEHPRCAEGSAIRTHVLYWMARDYWRLRNVTA